jgi:1-acyl-sn-glycerol-3-phosphate acyltransferase
MWNPTSPAPTMKIFMGPPHSLTRTYRQAQPANLINHHHSEKNPSVMVPVTYRFLRPLARGLVRLFFRRLEVQGLANVPETGPVLFAANHPNMLMDPLLLGTSQPLPLSFLAKATLFQSPLLGRFLASCGVLPVYRRKDSPGETGKNELTFEACFRLLEKGGAICIFPEGVSHPRDAVLPLKTGCARIALEGEEKNEFRLGVKILPVGLYFTERTLFRSDALVVFGPIIEPSAFFDDYRANPTQAVRALTAKIESRLRKLTLHVPRAEDERFIACLRQFFASSAEGISGNVEVNPTLVKAVEYFRDADPSRYRRVRRDVLSYCDFLSALGVSDSEVGRRYRMGPVLRYLAPRIAFAAAGAPVFLWGAINNYLPYKIPAWISRLVTRELVEVATVKFMSGLVSFPVFYALQTWLVGKWLGMGTALAYFFLLPAAGLFALFYAETLTGFAEDVRVFFLHLLKRDLIERLQKRRNRIVRELERAGEEYSRTKEH